ncbi:MAG: hypothetical protein HY935_01380 [Nitrosomonadales bacterium]|nr:hypothetical protein [Nitrosomonadales bacterium]
MKIASLSPDQAPPIGVPLRFFAVAPVFLVLAALLLTIGDGNPFANTHSPALLAATHCITLGFMAMVMLGAIQQVVPVLIGSQMPAPRLVAWLTMLPLMGGALLLTTGFALSKPELLNLSWPLLGLAFLVFIGASLFSLARATAKNPTRTAILLSILSLAGAVTLGMLMARGYAAGLSIPYARLATAHISLALGGGVMLLIVGVSYQVVPMFQLTPNYPKWLTTYLSPAIFGALLLSLIPLTFESAPRWPGLIAEIIFWILTSGYAVITLKLQSQRRRRVPDATLSFFRLGMIALLVAASFSLGSLLPTAYSDHLRMLSVLTFLLGFAMSVIQGMLYKIIPFLVWFHLFRGGVNAIKVGIPNMKEIIPERWMWWHLKLHGGTLLAALLATRLDMAAWLVMLGLLLQGILLGCANFAGISVYRRTYRRIEQAST